MHLYKFIPKLGFNLIICIHRNSFYNSNLSRENARNSDYNTSTSRKSAHHLHSSRDNAPKNTWKPPWTRQATKQTRLRV